MLPTSPVQKLLLLEWLSAELHSLRQSKLEHQAFAHTDPTNWSRGQIAYYDQVIGYLSGRISCLSRSLATGKECSDAD